MCGVLLQCVGSCQEEDLLALHVTPSPRPPATPSHESKVICRKGRIAPVCPCPLVETFFLPSYAVFKLSKSLVWKLHSTLIFLWKIGGKMAH